MGESLVVWVHSFVAPPKRAINQRFSNQCSRKAQLTLATYTYIHTKIANCNIGKRIFPIAGLFPVLTLYDFCKKILSISLIEQQIHSLSL